MRITQVVSHLLTNSTNCTKHGIVYISTESMDGQVVVSVKDIVSGIDPEIRSRIFTKFKSKSDTGTGLGLCISESIAEAHNGTIWAENNKDGRGATFSFILPLES